MNILLLCDLPLPGANASTVTHHIEAIGKQSAHNTYVLSSLGDLPSNLDLEWFDALVIHYSIYMIGDGYLTPHARERISQYSGLKAAFIQDEYRTINRFQDMIDELRLDVLFTCMPPEIQAYIYPKHALPHLRIEQVLTGYVDERLTALPSPPIAGRPIDVGYRGRTLSYWYGRSAMEKSRIGYDFMQIAGTRLKVNVSANEADRLYGDRWIAFIQSCRAVLGVESAVSIFDFTGKVQARTEAYLEAHPSASFDEVEASCFPGIDNRLQMGQISPRCFEAAALKTALILFPGSYSGVLEAGRHYIVLNKDYSNIDEVVRLVQDDSYLQEMVDRTYQEVARNPRWLYQAMVDIFDTTLNEEMICRNKLPSSQRRRSLTSAEFFEYFPLSDGYHSGRMHGAYLTSIGAATHYATLRHDSMFNMLMNTIMNSSFAYQYHRWRAFRLFMLLPIPVRRTVRALVYRTGLIRLVKP